MVRITVAALLTFALSVYAVGDPAGAANVGNGQGKQFITGACTSDADCASGCCAGLQDGAVCSARDVANDAGKKGCGFPNSAGGGAGGAGGAAGGNIGQNNGQNNGQDNGQNNGQNNGQGKQFITGACNSDAECASGCCDPRGNGGVCAARLVATENGKQGCGFNGAGAGNAVGGNVGQNNGQTCAPVNN